MVLIYLENNFKIQKIEVDEQEIPRIPRLQKLLSKSKDRCVKTEGFSLEQFNEFWNNREAASAELSSYETRSLYLSFYGYPKMIKGGYKWWEDSCNVDSLLIIFYESMSSFWRDIFLWKNLDATPLFLFDNLDCSRDIKTLPKEKMRDLGNQLIQAMKDEFNQIHLDNKIIKCENIRKYLRECAPDIYQKGRYIEYDIREIYYRIISLIPTMKFEIPILKKEAKIPEKKLVDKLNLDDYLTGEINGSKIVWSSFDSEILVIESDWNPQRNGRNLIELGLNFKLDFSFTVKYSLIAAVIGPEGHFFSYFKPPKENYYIKYNDLDHGKISNIKYSSEELSDLFFREDLSKKNKAIMWFYQKNY